MNKSGDSSSSSSSLVYSIDERSFASIIALVAFYCVHSLKENFPQLDTTLGMPFKDALPPHMSVAYALHDYAPNNIRTSSNEQVELKKDQRYFVISKDASGWYRVHNEEGLVGYAPGSYLVEKEISSV